MISKDINAVDLGFDIIIVGAGAAGCVLARNLSKQFKVLLIDSKRFPRHKACSGVLVSEAKEFFDDDLSEEVFLQPKQIDIEYVDVDNKLRNNTKKGFLNANRFALDYFLFNSLKDNDNVTFIENTKMVEFSDAHDKKHKVVICESNGVIKPIITKYLVGCDGALSSIRKTLTNSNIRFYIGVQEFIKCNKEFDRAYFIFDSQITDFYSWIIPKKPYVEIGTLLDPYSSKEKFELLKEKLAKDFGITGSGKLDSALVLRPSSIKDIILGQGNIFLCGEAAGLISPSSAEGISYALRSAKYCADAFNSGKEPQKEYARNCKPMLERLDEKFKKSEIISDKSKRKVLFQ